MSKVAITLFISYKTAVSRAEAGLLRNALSDIYETVYMDDISLTPGEPFPEQLFNMIRRSDVLLVAIGENTSDSEWVKREIEIARALNITILPVIHINDSDKYTTELAKLALSEIQATFMTNLTAHEKNNIKKAIESGVIQTRTKQNVLFDELRKRRQPKPAPFEQSHKVYQFQKTDKTLHPTNIHLTIGDVTNVHHVDVLVNSENTDMQMARFFEHTRISSILRNRGSSIFRGLLRDTIQDEINIFLDGSQPVPPTTIVPTSAGLSGSGLRMINHARYIFHVASVIATPEGLKPLIEFSQIEACIFQCMIEIKNVNAANGIISPEGTEQRKEQEAAADEYTPIRSILFPLFGTGHGGRPIKEVAEYMVEAFAHYLNSYEIPELEEIHLSVFFEKDVNIVLEVFDSHPQFI